MVAGDTRVVRLPNAERRGRSPVAVGVDSPALDSFVLGTTLPTPANTGYRYPLTAWTGTTGTLKITSPGAVYERIDFGSTWIDVEAADVTFRDCRFVNTKAVSTGRGLISSQSPLVSNLLIEFCEIRNAPTGGNITAVMNGVMGHDFTLRRSNVRGFTDALGVYVATNNIDGPIRTRVEGCYLNELSWWYDSTVGVIHPSDTKSHNDTIQHQGGVGLELVGNYIGGYYSTTVGTFDTPENNNIRTQIVFGDGAYPQGNGGSLSALMFTPNRGIISDNVIADNWIGGGAFSINAGAASIGYYFGDIHRNRFYRDQRSVGWAIGVRNGIATDVGFTTAGGNNYTTGSSVGDIATADVNTWIDDGSPVVRKNA